MCFNPTASLIAFSIGFVSWIILLYLKLYNSSIIVLYLSIMQILEYYAHISIINKDNDTNIITSKLIFIFALIQPILYYTSTLLTKGKYYFNNANKYLFLIPCYFLFLVIFYFYLNSKNVFKTTYLNDTCDTICRLSWDFFGYNKIFTIIAFIFYIFICLIFWKKYALVYYAHVLILISVIYTLFLSRDIKVLVSIFGSIWCFLAVTYGPLVILDHFGYFK